MSMVCQRNTVRQALDGLVAELIAADRRPEYIRNVRTHASRVTFDGRLELILRSEVVQWAKTLGGSPAYRCHTLMVLGMAVQRSDASPVVKAYWSRLLVALRPRVERKDPTILSEEEAEALIMGTGENRPLKAALLLALHAGLRHQEILHLTWGDVADSDNVRVTAKPHVGWSPKSHEERTIPMSSRLRNALESLREEVIELRVDREGQAFMFPWDRAAALPRRTWGPPVRNALLGLGVSEDRRPGLHMLRRTWATRALQKGMTLPDLMKLAGWTKTETAMRYLAPDLDAQRRVIDRL